MKPDFSTVRRVCGDFIRKNTVFCIAFCAACLTMFFVPPDEAYAGYFDWKTLACLFGTLAVICALKRIRFFTILARRIVLRFRTTRSAILALVIITFLGSMLLANDMALLTFLPLGYFVMSETGKEEHMAFTFIMQNIAANLGGMLTPFGNPQNLYLFSRFSIPTGEFMLIMLPPFCLAVAMIVACCFLFVRQEPIALKKDDPVRMPRFRVAVYLLLFALAIVMVFGVIPYWLGALVILASLLILDYWSLSRVDYPLLLTFACFFVFSGNMARVSVVRDFFSSLLSFDPLLVSALSCQVISNVPSAVLLSQFTDAYRELLLGVNIGGTGTLIASLASLITFREYYAHNPDKKGAYVLKFSLYNFTFLAVMLVFCELFPSLV